MIDIQKLAKLTGIHLSTDEENKLGLQLESVVSLLEKVKNYDVQPSNESWYDLIWLETLPQVDGIPDGDANLILENVDHPVVWHAVEVRAFVE